MYWGDPKVVIPAVITSANLPKIVDQIIEISHDREAAHVKEDELHLRLIEQFCPGWVKKEVGRLREADFPRYYI